MESPELIRISVAGGEAALDASAMVVSRSKGPGAASCSTARCTAATLAFSVWPRDGPKSTWPSGRCGVRVIAVGCPLPGATTYAVASVLPLPAERSIWAISADSVGSGSLPVAVAAMISDCGARLGPHAATAAASRAAASSHLAVAAVEKPAHLTRGRGSTAVAVACTSSRHDLICWSEARSRGVSSTRP